MDFTGRIHMGSKRVMSGPLPVQDSSGNQYTLPAGTGTVLVAMKPTNDIYIYKSGTSGSVKVTFYLCDSSGGNAVAICSISVTAGSPIKSGSVPSAQGEQSHNLSGLAGKDLYVKFTLTSGSDFQMSENMPISIKSPYTAVVAGEKIVTGDINQTGTSISAGTVMSNSHFSSGTKVEASTFNSEVLGL